MSWSTSKARSRWLSRKREYTEVVSLPVPAFTSAPMASKASSISRELKRSVPLKSRCSRKCEMPAWSWSSSREPARTQNPRAIERTEGIASVTTRTPESRVVSRAGSVLNALLAALAVPVAWAALPVPAAAASLAPAATVATVAAASALVAGAHGSEFLGRLAGDLRVFREAQADAATLRVNLDDLHLQLVAAVDDLLDRVRTLARGDVGDVDQAVGALGELDEGAEGGRLHDLAGELVAELHLLRHRADAVHQGVALLARLGVDADHAVVVDVDLRVELLRQRADRLAALADDRTDLLGVDLDRGDPRRVGRQLRARLRDGFLHLGEDRHPRVLGLLERPAQDLERDARDLDVHLERVDALGGTGDLEVHVAEMVLHARDVGEHHVVLTLLDETHRHSGHRRLDRHAGVHQRQRRAADRCHRARAVRLEDVRHHADRVRELVHRGHDRHERAFGKRPMSDVTPLRAAHEAGLSHRERREVVVVEVVLALLEAERVETHLVARRAESGDREGLRLAAGKDRRAVRTRPHSHLDPDVADLLRRAAVRTLLVHGDAAADGLLLELVEGELHGGAVSRGAVLVDLDAGAERLEHLRLDRLRRVLALELVDHLGRRVEGVAEALADLTLDRLVHLRRLDLGLLLAGLLAQVVLRLAEPLDLGVRDVERIEDLGLCDLVGARLDHQDGLFGAGHHEVERRLEQPLLVGVHEEVALGVLPDPHGAHGHREGDVGHHERGACAVHGEDVVGMLVVDRHRDRDELRVAVPALGEERAQWPVDHARGQGGLLAGPALAAEEAAGDLARGVHPLLYVDRQW